MKEIYQMLNSSMSSMVGMSLLHTLWQGLIIFLLLNLIRTVFKKDNPVLNYRLLYSALLLQIVWLVYTINNYFTLPYEAGAISSGSGISFFVNSIEGDTSFWSRFLEFLDTQSATIFLLWLAGVSFLTIRFFGGLVQVHLIKVRNRIEVDGQIKQLMDRLRLRLNISRKIKIYVSTKMNIPVVIGFLKPVILVPVGLLSGLSGLQVEALLMHELAHIKRNDFLMNLVQSIAEIVLFFNPFTWWISNRIRLEREKICDDMVMRYANRIDYARALVATQEWEANPTLAVGLHSGKGELINRINRIMGKYEKWGYSFKKMMAYMVVLSLLATTLAFSTKEKEPKRSETAVVLKSDIGLMTEMSTVEENVNAINKGSNLTSKSKTTKDEEVKTDSIPPKKKTIDLIPPTKLIPIDTPLATIQMEQLMSELKLHQEEWAKVMAVDQQRLLEQLSKVDLNLVNTQVLNMAEELEKVGKFRFEISQEQMEEAQVNLQKVQEQMERLSLEINNSVQEKMEMNINEMKENMEKMKEDMKQLEERMAKCTGEIKEQALKDGYIKSKDSKLNFSWEDEGIYINHQKLKPEDEEKYEKIWKKYFHERGKGIHYYQ